MNIDSPRNFLQIILYMQLLCMIQYSSMITVITLLILGDGLRTILDLSLPASVQQKTLVAKSI